MILLKALGFATGAVCVWLVTKVGAESTGTTTLARDLARALETEWVPEYGREYSERKQAAGDEVWRSEEFFEIAREQTRMEEQAARQANRILICDTNAFATCLWHRRYMGFDHEPLEEFAKGGRADLYLLTGNEIPFVQDGLRDGEHIRHEMHQWFEAALARQHVPWVRICGSAKERLSLAMKSIQGLLLP